jgi:hypothetical protein
MHCDKKAPDDAGAFSMLVSREVISTQIDTSRPPGRAARRSNVSSGTRFSYDPAEQN